MKNKEVMETNEAEAETPMLTMQRGRTTFLIGLHFAEKGKETLEDKVKKLIRRDVDSGNF